MNRVTNFQNPAKTSIIIPVEVDCEREQESADGKEGEQFGLRIAANGLSMPSP